MNCSPHLIVMVCVGLLGCGKQETAVLEQLEATEWTSVGADELDENQTHQRDRAIAAREAMFEALFAELQQAMQDGGPVAGIEICASRAPEIAAEIAESHGVRIGRTSWKLRNPKNSPPDWAVSVIDERPTEPVFFAGASDHLGVVTPVHIQPNCLQCHGSPDELAPGVSDQLARHYPEDQATGFAEGDLRGWFWIEVPGER